MGRRRQQVNINRRTAMDVSARVVQPLFLRVSAVEGKKMAESDLRKAPGCAGLLMLLLCLPGGASEGSMSRRRVVELITLPRRALTIAAEIRGDPQADPPLREQAIVMADHYNNGFFFFLTEAKALGLYLEGVTRQRGRAAAGAADPALVILPGRRAHVAVTYDDRRDQDNLRFFVDGVLRRTVTVHGAIGWSGHPKVLVGGNDRYPFPGEVVKVVIKDRALCDEEIAELSGLDAAAARAARDFADEGIVAWRRDPMGDYLGADFLLPPKPQEQIGQLSAELGRGERENLFVHLYCLVGGRLDLQVSGPNAKNAPTVELRVQTALTGHPFRKNHEAEGWPAFAEASEVDQADHCIWTVPWSVLRPYAPSVPAQSGLTVWLHVHAPENTTPGRYRYALAVSLNSGHATLRTPVTVNVRSARLPADAARFFADSRLGPTWLLAKPGRLDAYVRCLAEAGADVFPGDNWDRPGPARWFRTEAGRAFDWNSFPKGGELPDLDFGRLERIAALAGKYGFKACVFDLDDPKGEAGRCVTFHIAKRRIGRDDLLGLGPEHRRVFRWFWGQVRQLFAKHGVSTVIGRVMDEVPASKFDEFRACIRDVASTGLPVFSSFTAGVAVDRARLASIQPYMSWWSFAMPTDLVRFAGDLDRPPPLFYSESPSHLAGYDTIASFVLGAVHDCGPRLAVLRPGLFFHNVQKQHTWAIRELDAESGVYAQSVAWLGLADTVDLYRYAVAVCDGPGAAAKLGRWIGPDADAVVRTHLIARPVSPKYRSIPDTWSEPVRLRLDDLAELKHRMLNVLEAEVAE